VASLVSWKTCIIFQLSNDPRIYKLDIFTYTLSFLALTT
jgi:hypothetical protein